MHRRVAGSQKSQMLDIPTFDIEEQSNNLMHHYPTGVSRSTWLAGSCYLICAAHQFDEILNSLRTGNEFDLATFYFQSWN